MKIIAAGRWRGFPLAVQLANVGSEVERALTWRGKNNPNTAAWPLTGPSSF